MEAGLAPGSPWEEAQGYRGGCERPQFCHSLRDKQLLTPPGEPSGR